MTALLFLALALPAAPPALRTTFEYSMFVGATEVHLDAGPVDLPAKLAAARWSCGVNSEIVGARAVGLIACVGPGGVTFVTSADCSRTHVGSDRAWMTLRTKTATIDFNVECSTEVEK